MIIIDRKSFWNTHVSTRLGILIFFCEVAILPINAFWVGTCHVEFCSDGREPHSIWCAGNYNLYASDFWNHEEQDKNQEVWGFGKNNPRLSDLTHRIGNTKPRSKLQPHFHKEVAQNCLIQEPDGQILGWKWNHTLALPHLSSVRLCMARVKWVIRRIFFCLPHSHAVKEFVESVVKWCNVKVSDGCTLFLFNLKSVLNNM